MTKWEKRLQRIRNNPRNVRFEELDLLLIELGFERRQTRHGSSHYVYTRGRHRLTVPMNRPHLKEVYVKQVLQIIEEIGDE